VALGGSLVLWPLDGNVVVRHLQARNLLGNPPILEMEMNEHPRLGPGGTDPPLLLW
jgi:hypothetical protein